jgi:hypothetical protein
MPQPDGWTYELDEPLALTNARHAAKVVLWVLAGAVGLAVAVAAAAVFLVGLAVWLVVMVGVGLLTPLSIAGGFAARQGMRSWNEVTG